MSFALIFFPHSRTSDVVPASSVPRGTTVGETARIRWEGRYYKGKVLFTGPKMVRELKLSAITMDGDLADELFDISPLPQDGNQGDDDAPTSSADAGPSPTEREIVMWLIRTEEDTALMKNMIIQMNPIFASHTQRLEGTEQVGKELLRRNPTKQTQGNIVYACVSARAVAELRELRGQNRNHFALTLEKMVYRDDPKKMELLVDDRNEAERFFLSNKESESWQTQILLEIIYLFSVLTSTMKFLNIYEMTCGEKSRKPSIAALEGLGKLSEIGKALLRAHGFKKRTLCTA